MRCSVRLVGLAIFKTMLQHKANEWGLEWQVCVCMCVCVCVCGGGGGLVTTVVQDPNN